MNQFRKALRKIAEHKQRIVTYEMGQTANYTGAITRSGIEPITAQTPNGCCLNISNQVTQFSTGASRIGDKMTGTSAHIRISSYSELESVSAYFLRVVVFIWKDDTVPQTPQEIFVGLAGTTNITCGLQYDIDKKIKSKILHDKCYTMGHGTDGAATTALMNDPNQIDIMIDLTKVGKLNVVDFQGGSQIGVNHIYCLMMSNLAEDENEFLPWTHHVTMDYRFIDV